MEFLNAHPEVEVVGAAHNKAFALQLVSLQKPDAVLIDIHLGDNDEANNGMAFLAELKLLHPHVNAVMLTNLADEFYKTKCIELGASSFLDKSDDYENIIRAIKNLA